MQNQQQETTTKSLSSSTKWIDYGEDSSGPQMSDSDEDQKNLKSSDNINTNQEQYTLDKIDKNNVWLLAQLTSGDQRQAYNKLFKLRQTQSNPDIRVYNTNKEKGNRWDVEVPKQLAKKLLQKGLEDAKNIKFTVHKRNFQRKDRPEGGQRRRGGRGGRGRRQDRNDRGQRSQRGERGDRADRGHRNGDREKREKKKYVDKQTGQQSDNKKILEQRLIEQKDRQYTKKQSMQIGQSMGSFRNKPLEQRRKQIQQREKDKKVQQPKFVPKHTWKRKDTHNQGKSELAEDQKQSQTASVQIKQTKEAEKIGKVQAKQQRKVHFPKNNNKGQNRQHYQKKDGQFQEPKLFKKFSDIRGQKQYRKYDNNGFDNQKGGKFKKEYDTNKSHKRIYQQNNGDLDNKQEQKEKSNKKQQTQAPQNEGNQPQKKQWTKKDSESREFGLKKTYSSNYNNNKDYNREYNNRGRGDNKKPRKYQQKTQKNDQNKDKRQVPKKEPIEDKNHFSGMMSEDSDN